MQKYNQKKYFTEFSSYTSDNTDDPNEPSQFLAT